MVAETAPLLLRTSSLDIGRVTVSNVDIAGTERLLLDLLNTKLSRYTPFGINISFREYVDILADTFGSNSISKKYENFYASIFLRLLDVKRDYFYRDEWYIFLCQLLFGVRFSEVASLSFSNDDKVLTVQVKSLKGTGNRLMSYSLSSPLILMFTGLSFATLNTLTYKNYYRALIRSNPNFYNSFGAGHSTVTHIARHMFVQVLYYVLGLRDSAIDSILGWIGEDTIESYIDVDIWHGVSGVSYEEINRGIEKRIDDVVEKVIKKKDDEVKKNTKKKNKKKKNKK